MTSKTAMMRQAGLAVMLIAAVGGCDNRITRPLGTPAGPHFSVMTYNVNYGMAAPNLAVRAIRQTDADIVFLQETTPAWRRYLSSELAEAYPHRRYRHYNGSGGMGVLSKLPFTEISYVHTQAGWFPSWTIQADTPVGPVQICNVHLRPPLTNAGELSIGQYFKSPATHRQELAEACGNMDPELPRLVVGDFNENDFGGGIKWLAEQGFTDALSQFDTASKTWRWNTSLFKLRDRLDHILYSGDLHSVSGWVVNEGLSDHLPVVAVIERATPQPAATAAADPPPADASPLSVQE